MVLGDLLGDELAQPRLELVPDVDRIRPVDAGVGFGVHLAEARPEVVVDVGVEILDAVVEGRLPPGGTRLEVLGAFLGCTEAADALLGAVRAEPSTLDELRTIVRGAKRIRALGSRHAFNDIADSDELVSLSKLPAPVGLTETSDDRYTKGIRA